MYFKHSFYFFLKANLLSQNNEPFIYNIVFCEHLAKYKEYGLFFLEIGSLQVFLVSQI